MEIIKTILGKLGAGVLYGVGFFIGFAIIAVVGTPYFQSRITEESEETMRDAYVEFDESANLSAEVTSEKIGGGDFTLLGRLSNEGEHSWSSVTLRAELYDENGEFINECEEWVRQTLDPDSGANFKLSCGSDCSPINLDDYASYELMVVDARHNR